MKWYDKKSWAIVATVLFFLYFATEGLWSVYCMDYGTNSGMVKSK